MKNNIKNNKEDTLQGMRAITIRKGCREDNSESNKEKSMMTKRPGMEN